jgi:hypothetical protein
MLTVMIKEVRTSNRVVYNVVSYLPCSSSTTFAMSKSAHCNHIAQQNKDRRVLTLKRRAQYRGRRRASGPITVRGGIRSCALNFFDDGGGEESV